MKEMLCLAAAVTLCLAPAGCKKTSLTAEECEDMSGHMGDVLSPNESPESRAVRHSARRASTGHDQKIAECQRDARRADYDCIMAAKAPADLKKCDDAK
jgi:hypothetical protein